MPDPKDNPLLKMVGTLATQKEELATKERELVASLNSGLERMGYRVVPLARGVPKGDRRGPSRASRRATAAPQARKQAKKRRPMSAAERKAVSRRMQAYWSKRKKAGKKPK